MHRFVLSCVLLALACAVPALAAPSAESWLILVNQSRTLLYESLENAPNWMGPGSGLGLDVSIDLSRTTHFETPGSQGEPPAAGTVADDFPVPAGHTCRRIYVALDGYQFFARNVVWNETTSVFDSKPGNAQNPLRMLFGIFYDNATTHAAPNDTAVIWLNVTAPVGDWVNMTNFANGQFSYGRSDMTQWFELDLSSLNGGLGLTEGRYWLVINAYVNANYAYTYIDPADTSRGKAPYYNLYQLWAVDTSFPIDVYGANAVRVDHRRGNVYYTRSVPNYAPWSDAYWPGTSTDIMFGVSMRMYGLCAGTGAESLRIDHTIPPPVCVWSTPLPNSEVNWVCPLTTGGNTSTPPPLVPPTSVATAPSAGAQPSPITASSDIVPTSDSSTSAAQSLACISPATGSLIIGTICILVAFFY